MNNARFMVACSDSAFFNISSAALTILDSIGTGGELAESEDVEEAEVARSVICLFPYIYTDSGVEIVHSHLIKLW